MPGYEGLLSCSFCGSSQEQVDKLIAGPHGYICDGCVSRAHAVIAAPDHTASTPIATIQRVTDETESCSFCGKHRRQVAAMVSTGDMQICDECVELCDEIISEEADGPGQ